MYSGLYTGFNSFSMCLGFLRICIVRQVTAGTCRNLHIPAFSGAVLNIMPVYCVLCEESLAVVPTTILLGSFPYFTYAMLRIRLLSIVPPPQMYTPCQLYPAHRALGNPVGFTCIGISPKRFVSFYVQKMLSCHMSLSRGAMNGCE